MVFPIAGFLLFFIQYYTSLEREREREKKSENAYVSGQKWPYLASEAAMRMCNEALQVVIVALAFLQHLQFEQYFRYFTVFVRKNTHVKRDYLI